MQIKEGVILAGLNIKMRNVLTLAEDIWEAHDQELVVTSGLDGVHSAGSLHYYGLALDFRTKYFRPGEKNLVADELRQALQGDYDVVVENSHIHVEYDV